ncbi:MAG: hypothetical protein NC120_03680 [Ruminococcus sp.]|nr:hypothetical protein [Ruminococcus sp.]
MKKGSFILPLILTIAAVVYLIWIRDVWASDSDLSVFIIMSLPGILAVLSSVIAIILIGKYKLNINRYLLMYIVTSLFSPAAAIAVIYAVSKLICNIYNIDEYYIYEMIAPVPYYALFVIVPIVMIIIQFFLLNIKIKSFAEKFILIILNPALYFFIFEIAVAIDISISGFRLNAFI